MKPKKSRLVSLVLFLSVILLLASLIQIGVAGAKTKARTLKYASSNPPTAPISVLDKWMLDEITKRTDGRLKFNCFWSQTLLRDADITSGVGKGVADFGDAVGRSTSARNPCWSTLSMPGVADDVWPVIWASYELLHTNPGIKAEFDYWNVVPTRGYAPGGDIFGFRKPVPSLADMKGKRFRCPGGALCMLVKLTGGLVAVQMPWPDLYEALDRGTIDGAFFTLQLQDAFKLYEVVKYYYHPSLGYGSFDNTMVINKNVWNSFSKKDQDIINQVSRDANNHWAQTLKSKRGEWRSICEKAGVKFFNFTPEENAAYEKAAKVVHKEWVDRWEAKGHPVRQTWNQYQELIAKYEKELKEKGYPK